MKIHALPSGPIQTNGYLLTESSLGQAVLVDAPGGILDKVRPILEKEQCKLVELWLTHGHWDHMQDGATVRAAGVIVRAHEADRALIETPEIMDGFMGQRLGIPGVKVDAWFDHGDRLRALDRVFEVRHVPGHCPGNVLYYIAAIRAAFVGDTLFNGGVGRTDFPGGDFDVLMRSIHEQIFTLPADTLIFSGHGPKTTVANERAANPYVGG